MWRRVLTAAIALVGLPMPTGGWALDDPACGGHSEVLATFASQYGEVPQVLAFTEEGGLIEVLVAPGGTWTMVLTMPGEPTCIVATGKDWQVHPAASAKPLT